MECACCFVNISGRAGLAGMAHGVTSGLGHTLKALPEATIGCEVLLREHSGHLAPRGIRQSRAVGHRKAQSPYCSCHATFPACFCIGLSLAAVLCDQL